MKSVELSLKGSKDYLNVIGGFIRHAYFFNKKAFKFIGLDAKYLDGDKEQVRISTVFGVEIPETILLKLNTVDLSSLENHISGSYGSEKIVDFREESNGNGFKIVTESVSDEIIRFNVRGCPKIIRSSDIIPGQDEFDLYSVVSPREIDLNLYVRYDFGFKSSEENSEILSSLASDIISVDTLHKCDARFGYTVTDGREPRLILNIDDSLNISDVKDIFNYTVSKIQSADW